MATCFASRGPPTDQPDIMANNWSLKSDLPAIRSTALAQTWSHSNTSLSVALLCARRLKDPRRIKTKDLRSFTHKSNNYNNFASEKKLPGDGRQRELKGMRSTQTLQDRDASADSSAAEERKGSMTGGSLSRSNHHDQAGKSQKGKDKVASYTVPGVSRTFQTQNSRQLNSPLSF